MKKKEFKKQSKFLMLKGEGIHVHEAEGDLLVNQKQEFSELYVNSSGILHHKNPLTNSFGEHNPIKLEKGLFVQGTQIEWNPWQQDITQIWD